MPDDFQPGPHLSPDQLSAFAENVLPEHERLAALTHLCTCADCRQVVYLAQQADPAPIATPVTETPRRGWFTLPQLFGAATAAFACALILALILHLHHDQTASAPAVTTAKVEAPTVPSPSNAILPSQEQLNSTQSSSASTKPQTAPSLPEPKPESLPKLAAPAPSPKVVGAVGAGMSTGYNAEAKQKSTSNNDALSARSSSNFAALTPQKTPVPAAIPMQMAAAPPPPAAENRARQSATDTAIVTAAAPMVANEGSTLAITMNTMSVEDLPSARRATAPFKLPSKKPVASQLSVGNRTLALDTTGALFVSNDNGKHWTAVATQWAGKAVQLSFATTPARLYFSQPQQAQTQSQATSSLQGNAAAGVPQQQPPIPTASYELSTATGAVWVSTDGLTWHQR